MEKLWTPEELDYLKEAWGTVSISQIAKHLGRTVNAVKVKSFRINLRDHLHSGENITVSELCKAIGVDYHTVTVVWGKRGFPFRKTKVISNSFKTVAIEDFWKWAEQHKQLVDFSRIEKNILGKEPAWVDEARRVSLQNRQVARKTRWSKEEEQRLVFLLDKTDSTIAEIAADIGRTEASVRRRIFDMGLKLHPVPAQKRYWTDEETSLVWEMLGKGYSYEQIGAKLGRSAHAVRGKCERTLNPSYLVEYRRREKQGDCFQRFQCTHYAKAKGCELGGTDCDECAHYKKIQDESERSSGWVSLPK